MTICTPNIGDHVGQMVNEGGAKQEGVDRSDGPPCGSPPRIRIEGAKNGQNKAIHQDKDHEGGLSIPGVIAGPSGITNPAIVNSLSRYGTWTCAVANASYFH